MTLAANYHELVDSVVQSFRKHVAARAGVLHVLGPILLILFTLWLANYLYHFLTDESNGKAAGDGSRLEHATTHEPLQGHAPTGTGPHVETADRRHVLGRARKEGSREPSPATSVRSHSSRHSHESRRVRTESNPFQPRASYLDTHGTLLASWQSPRSAQAEVDRILHGQTARQMGQGHPLMQSAGQQSGRATPDSVGSTLHPDAVGAGQVVREGRAAGAGDKEDKASVSPARLMPKPIRAPHVDATADDPPSAPFSDSMRSSSVPQEEGEARVTGAGAGAGAGHPSRPVVATAYSSDGWFNLVVVLAGYYTGTSLVHSRVALGAWLAGRAGAMVHSLVTVPALLRDVGVTAVFYFLFAYTHALIVAAGWMAPDGRASYALQAAAETSMLGGLILYARSQAMDWPLLARLALLMEAAVLTMKLHSHIAVNRELAVARQVLVKAVQLGAEEHDHTQIGQEGASAHTAAQAQGEQGQGRVGADNEPASPDSGGIEGVRLPTPLGLQAASRAAAGGLSWLTANLRKDAGTDKLDASLGLASPVPTSTPTPDTQGGVLRHRRVDSGISDASSSMDKPASGVPMGLSGKRLLSRLHQAWSSGNLLALNTAQQYIASRNAALYCANPAASGLPFSASRALETFPYPSNISLTDMASYTLAPTLVYEPMCLFPRTAAIRPLYVAEKVVVTGALVFAGMLLFSNSMAPALTDVYNAAAASAAGKTDVHEGGVLLDAVARMALPTTGLMMIIFYVTFECVCNACAELSRFGDRGFYADWWNSTTFAEFSRKWNKPVHEFLLRHVYLSFMGIPCSRVLLEGPWALEVDKAKTRLAQVESRTRAGHGVVEGAREAKETNGGRKRAASGYRDSKGLTRPAPRVSPQTALYLTFGVSIAVHEAILWGVFGWVTPWLALFSCLQFPLLTLLRLPLFRGKRLGNIVFWSGLIVGLATIIVLYSREYMLAECGGQPIATEWQPHTPATASTGAKDAQA